MGVGAAARHGEAPYGAGLDLLACLGEALLICPWRGLRSEVPMSLS